MVYDDVSTAGYVLLPVRLEQHRRLGVAAADNRSRGSRSVPRLFPLRCATVDPSSRVLTPVTGDCFPSDDSAIDSSSPNVICHGLPTDRSVTVELPPGTRTVVMQPRSATAFGAIRVSDDGQYLAYGAYLARSAAGITSPRCRPRQQCGRRNRAGYTPMQWLNDDRLVVSPSFGEGASYLLSPSFDNPVKLSADQPTGALP